MENLKIQKDVTAQVIVNIDGVKVVLDNCKVFANNGDGDQIIFQAQDSNNT